VGFWIGLGGYNPGGASVGKFLSQIGTEGDCRYGKAVYTAVEEMVPFDSGAETIAGPGTDKPIAARDYISAEVHYLGGTKYELTIDDYTQGWVITSPRVGSKEPEARYSAEWIVEDPTTQLPLFTYLGPLAKFSTITFFNCSVDKLSISSGPIINKINMKPSKSSNLVKAEPSNLDVSGTIFSVMWEHE